MLSITNLNLNINNNILLHDINFNVDEGEIISIIGPSGCGKSSILKSIVGIYKPTGNIVLDKIRIIDKPINQRNTALIFQDFSLFPHMTTFQNMKIASHDVGFINHTMNEFSILHLKDKYPGMLSGGEQQRVALARALVYKPKLLLLDEPFSNIDAITTYTVRKKMVEYINMFKITTILVTHDLDDVFDTSKRCIVMNNSEINQIDTLRKIFEAPKNKFVEELFSSINKCNGNFCKILHKL